MGLVTVAMVSTDAWRDDEPMFAQWGSEHPAAPLVVILHGNGTSEHSMIEISPWLPHGPVAYVAVRAPILHGRGFSWYLDDDPATLDATCRRLASWLDDAGERPVLLLGFREGVTCAGALMVAEPERFSGAVLLHGALRLDDVPARARLAGMPVFLAHGDADTRTPVALLERTWDWLAKESGAPLWAERVPGGEQLAGKAVGDLGTWLGDRLDYLRAHGENPLPDGDEPGWPARLPHRAGAAPEVTTTIPQHQTSQLAPPDLSAALWERLTAFDAVTTAPTTVGVPGSRSLLLTDGTGPATAFLLPDAGEFAHQHPDGSVHVVLPDELAYDALAKGWAVPHPLAGVRVGAGTVLVPGPRDAGELEIVVAIAAAAHRYAMG